MRNELRANSEKQGVEQRANREKSANEQARNRRELLQITTMKFITANSRSGREAVETAH